MRIFIIGHTSPDLDSISGTVQYEELLRKTKRYKNAVIIPVCSGEPNKETKFVFEKFDVRIPQKIEKYKIRPDDMFILVDHNEEEQRHPSTEQGRVVEIIDHHKININFYEPVRIDMKPYGAMSTIIYELFDMYGIKPSKKAACLILSAILSDTQGLKSSTTTDFDRIIASDIAKKYKIDINKLYFELAEQKSDLKGMSAREIVDKDIKVYKFGGKKVFIGQVETVKPDEVLKDSKKLLEGLLEVKQDRKVSLAYLLITDIIKINSKILYNTPEEKDIVERAFNVIGEENCADIGPRTSRKRDIAIVMEATIENIQ